MTRFIGGFVSASVLWAAFTYAHLTGIIDINLAPEAQPAEDTFASTAATPEPDERAGNKRSHRTRGARPRRFAGEALSGDDLGGPETRRLDVGTQAGEQQLRSEEVEHQFDAVLPQIRRCLMLAASDEPVTGKVVFGLRIVGNAGVTKVNLRGPGAITQTEAGDCMRKAAHGMRFRSFDGPDMLVQFPMTLE